jgi:hypothetical protein
MSMAQVQDLSVQWNRLAGGFLLPRERVAGGMVPKYLVERIEAILRGSPLPARSSEREQVQGRLVRAYLWIAGGLAAPLHLSTLPPALGGQAPPRPLHGAGRPQGSGQARCAVP